MWSRVIRLLVAHLLSLTLNCVCVCRCSVFRAPAPASRVRTPVSWPGWCAAPCWRGSSPWWRLWLQDTSSRATWPTTGEILWSQVLCVGRSRSFHRDSWLFCSSPLSDLKRTHQKQIHRSRRRQRDVKRLQSRTEGALQLTSENLTVRTEPCPDDELLKGVLRV